MADLPPPGLSEHRFGIRYYEPDLHTLFEIVDLRRKSGELWGELTVRCKLEGVRTQLDGDRMRQGNFNFSSLATRNSWARALAAVTPKELNDRLEWGNLLERVCQAVLDHERGGAIHGHEIEGRRAPGGGRPWAAWPILPHGDSATLFARGGAGKTGLVAMVAFSMARGHSIIPGIRVDRTYRPLILDWETNPETAEDLWGLIAETYHMAVPKGVWYEPMEAPLERSLPKIANIMDKHRSDVVIIDSVMMSMISSAEGSGDAADGITRVYQSLRRLGAWGLLIDHIAGEEYKARRAATKAYGSIFKMNLARHTVSMVTGQRSGDTTRVHIMCPKSNVARDRWAMEGTHVRNDNEIRWEFSDPDYDLYDRLMGEVDPDEMPEAKLATPRAARRYLDYLGDAAHPGGRTATELATEFKISPAAARTALSRLRVDGLVDREAAGYGRGHDSRWYLTPNGQAFLAQSEPLDNILPFPKEPPVDPSGE